MKNNGTVFALITACISGLSIYVNTLFVSQTDPLIFTVLRNALIALFVSVVLIGSGQTKTLRGLNKKQWLQLVLIGVIGGGIPFALFFSGLAATGAVNGNILQKTLFLWVALLAVPLLKERISKLQMIGYLTLFSGLFVFGGTYTIVFSAGSYMILGATMLWAVEMIAVKRVIANIPPLVIAWARMVFGLPFLLGAVILTGKTVPVPALAASLVPAGVSSVLLLCYMGTWYTALSKAPATLVSSVLVFAPVITALAGIAGSHTIITDQQSIQMGLLTLGSFVMILDAVRPKRQIIAV
jgi:drug/metabolite transporter (DMT)-like permease